MLISIINTLTSVAIFIAVIKAYLVINKMWRRKAIEEVADSLSVTAKLMSFFILSVYLARAIFITGDWIIALDLVLALSLTFFFMLVGIKFWVPGKRASLWQATLRAVRSEEKELDNLLRGNKPPKEAELIARILYRVAALDETIAAEEKKILKLVSASWGVDMEKLEKTELDAGPLNLERLAGLVAEYLAHEPHTSQAKQALDLIQRLVVADKNLSDEEELAMSELAAMIQGYIENVDTEFEKYAACLIPQSKGEFDRIKGILGHGADEDIAGGRAFVIGRYYSRAFSEAVCGQYRGKGLMAVTIGA